MSHDQNKFSFELNESLYFEKGQEVAEMMRISLDPEIAIQPFHDYVSIRGVIELQGEYQKVIANEEFEGETNDFANYHAQRFMEQVTDTIEGGATFSHRFPVEISVPTYRVEDFNEITVNIASFDYEIPNQNQLNLKSTIDIHGISVEASDPRNKETEEKVEEETVTPIAENTEMEASREKASGAELEPEAVAPIAEDNDAEESRDQATEAELEPEAAAPIAEHKETEESRDKTSETEIEQDSSAAIAEHEEAEESREKAPEVELEPEPVAPIAEQREAEESRDKAPDADLEQEAVAPIEHKEVEESRDKAIQAVEEGEVDATPPNQNEEEDSFQFEIKEVKREELPAEAEILADTSPLSTELEGDIPDENSDEKNRWKNKKSQTLTEFFKNTPSFESSSFGGNLPEQEYIDPSSSHYGYGESSSYYESVERESSSEAGADVRYLADMFRGDEDEQYAQMRLCIVQNKDTIESIAARYQIPTLQLLKQNRLDGDDLSEGQLLYIPSEEK